MKVAIYDGCSDGMFGWGASIYDESNSTSPFSDDDSWVEISDEKDFNETISKLKDRTIDTMDPSYPDGYKG